MKKKVLLLIILLLLGCGIGCFFIFRDKKPDNEKESDEIKITEFVPLEEGQTRADGEYIPEDFIVEHKYDKDTEGEVIIVTDQAVNDVMRVAFSVVNDRYEKISSSMEILEDVTGFMKTLTYHVDVMVVDYDTFKYLLDIDYVEDWMDFVGTNICYIGDGELNIGITREMKFLCEQRKVDLSKYNLIVYDHEFDMAADYENHKINGYIGTGEYDKVSFRRILSPAEYYLVLTSGRNEYQEAKEAVYYSIANQATNEVIPYYVLYPADYLTEHYSSLADVPQHIIDDYKENNIELPKFSN